VNAEFADVTGAVATATPAAPRPAVHARLRRVYHDRVPPAGSVLAGRIGLAVGAIVLWEALGRLHVINPFLWSMPSLIAAEFMRTLRDGTLATDASFTFTATILGFIIGTVGGSAIGLSFWWSAWYARVMEPFLIVFEGMPKLALAPIVVLALGLGMESKVGMAVALTIVISALTTYSGMRAVDRDLVRMVFSLGASRWQVFSKVILPGTFPAVLSAMRINIGLALAGAIVGEFIGSQHGLGRLIEYAGQTYNIALIWSGVFTLSLLSIVLYLVTNWLERTLLRRFFHTQAPR
jgi:NitT/TauT family transport system permease protein